MGECREREKRTISQLPNPNESCHILVKHLKAATILLWLARVAETAWAVEDFLEGFEINCCLPKQLASLPDQCSIVIAQISSNIPSPQMLKSHLFLIYGTNTKAGIVG